jgi:hypothetical protein
MTKTELDKVIRIGTIQRYHNLGKSPTDIFCHVQIKDGKLSITGVEGPRRYGDSWGSCGQIVMSLKNEQDKITPALSWSKDMIARFFQVWEEWHLNDMRAGSPEQRAWLRANPIPEAEYAYPKSHYAVVSGKLAGAGLNPDSTGYKYGHAWLSEELPQEVVEFLQTLPETDKTPAWV